MSCLCIIAGCYACVQAVMVSEHKAQEVEKLRASMEALLQEAGQRTRREVSLTHCPLLFCFTQDN